MPIRETSFLNNNIYHVFNKTIEGKKLFKDSFYADLFLALLTYYRSENATVSYSRLAELKPTLSEEIQTATLIPESYRIHILSYCLMPTHFHLLIEQQKDYGIQKVISDVTNAFTRYYNRKNQRTGPLFLPRFKAVAVTSDYQLMHVSRYIHLNPYSAKIISKKEINKYPYSSLTKYLNSSSAPTDLVNNSKVMELFNNSNYSYRKFVLQNADYQQRLEHVKHIYTW